VARAQGDGPCHGRTMFFLEARSGVRVAALSHFPKEQVPSLSPSTPAAHLLLDGIVPVFKTNLSLFTSATTRLSSLPQFFGLLRCWFPISSVLLPMGSSSAAPPPPGGAPPAGDRIPGR